MTSLTTADLDIPYRSKPDRSHDGGTRVHPRNERLVRHRIRLDGNEVSARTSAIVPVSSCDLSNSLDSKARHRRSCLCLVERALRNSPANLRTTLVVLTVAVVLAGIMVATLGLFAVGVLIGLCVMYKPLCG